ncbi:MAG: sulfurtransferase TusA family protein [Candidatus Dormibacteria bacterium]
MNPSDEAPPRLDLRGIACPLTFVRTRIALDRLPRGRGLEVLLDPGEPADSVPRSCAQDGDQVLALGPWESDPRVWRMLVRRPPDPSPPSGRRPPK